VKEQDIKNASRGNDREPPVNTIPADARASGNSF
jgi:hypothetical protein